MEINVQYSDNPEEIFVESEYANSYMRDGILYSEMHPITPTLEQVKQFMENGRKLYKDYTPFPCLIITGVVKPSSKEVRDYLASEEIGQFISASAILMENKGFAKIAGNLFLKFSKPSYPTKIFSNKEKALEWLQQFK